MEETREKTKASLLLYLKRKLGGRSASKLCECLDLGNSCGGGTDLIHL